MNFSDSIALDDSAQVRITRDGYLVANPRAARIGIQVYRGVELGRRDVDTVKVFRPEEEVFHKDAMASLAHRPITNDHPPEMVDARNWRKYTVGNVGDTIARDGEYVRVPTTLMDADTISQVQAGKRELSVGYHADIDWTPGEFNGEKYDARMINIRGNHLAVVDTARGGSNLKIGDSNVNTKTIVVDGLSVELADKDAQIVERAMKKLTDDLAAANAARATADASLATQTALVATKDAELTTVKSQLADATSPAKIEAAARDRADVMGKARAVLGDKLVTDGKTTPEIRRQVVDFKLADVAKGWNDEQVAASFAAIVKDVKPGVSDPLADALSRSNGGSLNDAEKAHSEYVAGLSNQWQQTARA